MAKLPVLIVALAACALGDQSSAAPERAEAATKPTPRQLQIGLSERTRNALGGAFLGGIFARSFRPVICSVLETPERVWGTGWLVYLVRPKALLRYLLVYLFAFDYNVFCLELPPGWVPAIDPETGETYYVDEETGKPIPKEWKPSIVAGEVVFSNVETGESLPKNWAPEHEVVDGVKTGQTLYVNKETGKTQLWPPTYDFVHLDNPTAKVVRNNIGGLGPDPCLKQEKPNPDGTCKAGSDPPRGMIVERIGTLADGTSVDLEIQNVSEYKVNQKFMQEVSEQDKTSRFTKCALQKKNKGKDCKLTNELTTARLGSINQQTGWGTDFEFSFVKTGTGQRVKVPAFALSFLDVDEGGLVPKTAKSPCDDDDVVVLSSEPASGVDEWNGPGEYCRSNREFITTSGFEAYEAGDDVEVTTSASPRRHLDDAGVASGTTFGSTVAGNGPDNPTNALALTELQARRAVNLYFLEKSEVTVRLTVGPARADNARNILISGLSKRAA